MLKKGEFSQIKFHSFMHTSKKETALDLKKNYINDLNFCSKTMKLLNHNYAG